MPVEGKTIVISSAEYDRMKEANRLVSAYFEINRIMDQGERLAALACLRVELAAFTKTYTRSV